MSPIDAPANTVPAAEQPTVEEQRARAAVLRYVHDHRLPAPRSMDWARHVRELNVHVSEGDFILWLRASDNLGRFYVKAYPDVPGRAPDGSITGPGWFACLDLTIEHAPVSVLCSWRAEVTP